MGLGREAQKKSQAEKTGRVIYGKTFNWKDRDAEMDSEKERCRDREEDGRARS